jgi:hypothetical protein
MTRLASTNCMELSMGIIASVVRSAEIINIKQLDSIDRMP